jgi:hypothetical protein
MTRHPLEIKRKPARKPVAPRGAITAASAALGVTCEHLSRVLHGHRQSRSLSARFAQWLPTWQRTN